MALNVSLSKWPIFTFSTSPLVSFPSSTLLTHTQGGDVEIIFLAVQESLWVAGSASGRNSHLLENLKNLARTLLHLDGRPASSVHLQNVHPCTCRMSTHTVLSRLFPACAGEEPTCHARAPQSRGKAILAHKALEHVF